MSFGNHQSIPFWDFIRSMDAAEHGAGVDQPAFGAAPPAGPPPFAFGFGGPSFFGPPHHGHHGPAGRGGCGRFRGPPGRHCHRGDGERGPHCGPKEPKEPKEPKDPKDPENPEDPPKDGDDNAEGQSWGPRQGGPRHWGHRHGPWGRRGFGGPSGAPFDMSAMMEHFSSHPIAQALRSYAEAQQGEDADAENTFMPPIDVFSTPAAYVLHVALPGAKKEDVGVNWDAEKGELNVAGVVYRQGDEEFLKTLSKKERKVGVFERNVRLPPNEEDKEEVDGDNISAKLEDGVLIITVGKVEKEWTEVKKVDIE